jgi:DNA gyrase/topoisomerase IV subunit A
VEIREKYGDERRSLSEYSGGDVSIEDLIADENVVLLFRWFILNVLFIRNTNTNREELGRTKVQEQEIKIS